MRISEENNKVSVKRKRTAIVKKQEIINDNEITDKDDDYSISVNKKKKTTARKKAKAAKKDLNLKTEIKEECFDEITIKKTARTMSSRYNFRR